MTVSGRVHAVVSQPPPKMIRPITIDGITYHAVAGKPEEDGQIAGFLGAFDADERLLWKVKIYDDRPTAHAAGDAKPIYFADMTLLADGSLEIVNRAGKRFRFDPQTRAVTALPAPAAKPRAGYGAKHRPEI